LAVVEDVDPGGGLASNDVGDRIANPVRERRRLHGNALFLGEHDADQIFGTRQAAGVCREESIAATLHRAITRYQVSGVRSVSGVSVTYQCELWHHASHL